MLFPTYEKKRGTRVNFLFRDIIFVGCCSNSVPLPQVARVGACQRIKKPNNCAFPGIILFREKKLFSLEMPRTDAHTRQKILRLPLRNTPVNLISFFWEMFGSLGIRCSSLDLLPPSPVHTQPNSSYFIQSILFPLLLVYERGCYWQEEGWKNPEVEGNKLTHFSFEYKKTSRNAISQISSTFSLYHSEFCMRGKRFSRARVTSPDRLSQSEDEKWIQKKMLLLLTTGRKT